MSKQTNDKLRISPTAQQRWPKNPDQRWRRRSSRDAFVVLEHAAEPRVTNEPLVITQRLVSSRPVPHQRPIANALVRPQFVIVADEFGYEMIEVLPAKAEEPIKNFSLDRSNPPLDERGQRRTSRGDNLFAPLVLPEFAAGQ